MRSRGSPGCCADRTGLGSTRRTQRGPFFRPPPFYLGRHRLCPCDLKHWIAPCAILQFISQVQALSSTSIRQGLPLRDTKREETPEWRNAQLQFAATARRPRRRPARPVDTVVVTAAATEADTAPHAPPVGALPTAAVADPAVLAFRDRIGRGPARPSPTRRPRRCPSRQSVRPLSGKLRQSPTSGIASFATRGTTDRVQPRNSTIYLRRLVSKFGSARKTLAWACRWCEPSTRGWRPRRLGLSW